MYDSLNSRFDEWIPLYSPRIAKLHSCTWQNSDRDSLKQEVLIDDGRDPKI